MSFGLSLLVCLGSLRIGSLSGNLLYDLVYIVEVIRYPCGHRGGYVNALVNAAEVVVKKGRCCMNIYKSLFYSKLAF